MFHVELTERLVADCRLCMQLLQELLHDTKLGAGAIGSEIQRAHRKGHPGASAPAPRDAA
jgi:hypothetical protein